MYIAILMYYAVRLPLPVTRRRSLRLAHAVKQRSRRKTTNWANALREATSADTALKEGNAFFKGVWASPSLRTSPLCPRYRPCK